MGWWRAPPNIHDAEGGRRDGNLTDYRNFIKLAHHFNVVNIIGNQVCAPMELPANSRHLDTYHANITDSDLTFHVTAIGRGRVMDGINMMAISRGIAPEDMAAVPGVTTIISVNSPRLLDEAMTDGLIAMAEHGQPISITPFTLMGAMTPVTLPAAMAQQNAEALFGVVLTQLVRPGTPVMYGAFTSNVDMRSGAPAFGTPENAKANIIAGQLARRYGLPYRTSNANASNAVDLQATYETMMATWGATLGGANLVYHAAGWLEGGADRLLREVHPGHRNHPEHGGVPAPPVIRRCGSWVGRHQGSPHRGALLRDRSHRSTATRRHSTVRFCRTGAITRRGRRQVPWTPTPGPPNYGRPHWKNTSHPPSIPAVAEELDAYVAHRREEIGTGEP